MRDLVIVGVGGHGREVLECVLAINAVKQQWNLLGFVDDAPAQEQMDDWPVLGTTDWLQGRSCAVAVAVGAPAVRARLVRKLESSGIDEFPSLVHPSATVGRSVTRRDGSLVAAAATVTANVFLGRHALVNTGAVISHDCVLHDFATVAPAACLCGAVQVGEGADLGAGSIVVQGMRIGSWSVVGAGSTVIRPVNKNETVVGVPARCIGERTDGWQN